MNVCLCVFSILESPWHLPTTPGYLFLYYCITVYTQARAVIPTHAHTHSHNPACYSICQRQGMGWNLCWISDFSRFRFRGLRYDNTNVYGCILMHFCAPIFWSSIIDPKSCIKISLSAALLTWGKAIYVSKVAKRVLGLFKWKRLRTELMLQCELVSRSPLLVLIAPLC